MTAQGIAYRKRRAKLLRDGLSYMDRICADVAKQYGIPLAAIYSRRRLREYVLPRHIAMYLATRAGYSLPQIAEHFCRQDHTSVLYARGKISRLLAAGELRLPIGPQPEEEHHDN